MKPRVVTFLCCFATAVVVWTGEYLTRPDPGMPANCWLTERTIHGDRPEFKGHCDGDVNFRFDIPARISAPAVEENP